MHPDLQHLIQLQDLDLAIERFRRRVDDLPGAHAAIEIRLVERGAALEEVKARLAGNQAARREIEKDLAAVQSRLSKYKDQLMEVKTNKEYQAMQSEIGVAEQHVRQHEDRLLERMEEGENLAAEIKKAEASFRADKATAEEERKALAGERDSLARELERAIAERRRLAGELPAPALSLFEHVSKHRRGLALSEAKEGHCTQCHVRLRPQVYNDVRRNDGLIQCESCSRILYFVAPPAAGAATPPS